MAKRTPVGPMFIAESVKTVGGISINPETGERPGDESGYMVSLADCEKVIPLESFGPSDVLAYRSTHRGYWEDPRFFLGAWVSDGNVYLDVSERVEDAEDARAIGAERGQLAIWDLAGEREVTL